MSPPRRVPTDCAPIAPSRKSPTPAQIGAIMRRRLTRAPTAEKVRPWSSSESRLPHRPSRRPRASRRRARPRTRRAVGALRRGCPRPPALGGQRRGRLQCSHAGTRRRRRRPALGPKEGPLTPGEITVNGGEPEAPGLGGHELEGRERPALHGVARGALRRDARGARAARQAQGPQHDGRLHPDRRDRRPQGHLHPRRHAGRHAGREQALSASDKRDVRDEHGPGPERQRPDGTRRGKPVQLQKAPAPWYDDPATSTSSSARRRSRPWTARGPASRSSSSTREEGAARADGRRRQVPDGGLRQARRRARRVAEVDGLGDTLDLDGRPRLARGQRGRAPSGSTRATSRSATRRSRPASSTRTRSTGSPSRPSRTPRRSGRRSVSRSSCSRGSSTASRTRRWPRRCAR